ncbi:uncharacterized protein [Chiloscyllium punctatum]|uniref:uncharacterized protein n=1 Tax=Chiloscyllium punctatum TaxID=137246 RepID=UPI003B633500
MSIEIVDFGSFGLGKNEPSAIEIERISTEVIRALTDIGFVYLKNTGIEDQKIFEVMDICKEFFMLPSNIKQQYAHTVDSESLGHGWIAEDKERLNPERPADLKESFNISALSPHVKWPIINTNPEFRECLESFFKMCQQLSVKILEVIALGLGLERDFFINKHQKMGSNKNPTTLRALYYPSVQKSSMQDHQIRCGEHSDYGTFSLLFQDKTGGLEILNRSGEYVAAPYIQNTVLINIADLLQRWTSDKLLSTVHRVLLPKSEDKMCKPRQSLVFFVDPDNDVIVTCCNGLQKYPPIPALQHIQGRLNSSNVTKS